MRLPYVIGSIYMLIINAVIIFYEVTLGPVGVGIFIGAILLYASWCMVTPQRSHGAFVYRRSGNINRYTRIDQSLALFFSVFYVIFMMTIVTVDLCHEATVTRFGDFNRTLRTGIHLKIPFGIEQVKDKNLCEKKPAQ